VGSKTPIGRVASCPARPIPRTHVFKWRLTAVHHDGVELERTPLLQPLERLVARPQSRPPVQLFFEQLLVMTGERPGELVLIFALTRYTVVLLVDLGQGQGCEVGEGSAALIQSTKGCSYRRIRAARLSMMVALTGHRAGQGRPRSWRQGMVLVDQPPEDLAPPGRWRGATSAYRRAFQLRTESRSPTAAGKGLLPWPRATSRAT
jgi:hypothetical protein